MKRIVTIIAVLSIVFIPFLLAAEERLHLAVAANFMQPMQKITVLFEKKTKVKIETTYASTGKLYSQIVNGAPYDVFLSADEERPNLLYQTGISEKPFIYARGQVILWSVHKEFCKAENWSEAVRNKKIRKISIANVKTAPYGTMSMMALQKAGLWDSLQPKMVFAQDVAQSFQYASTESVDLGFCAFSAAFSDEGKKGCFHIVHEAPMVLQAACVVKQSKNIAAARQFVDFLGSSEVNATKKSFGYQ